MLVTLEDLSQHVWLLVARKLPFTRVTAPSRVYTEVTPREGAN